MFAIGDDNIFDEPPSGDIPTFRTVETALKSLRNYDIKFLVHLIELMGSTFVITDVDGHDELLEVMQTFFSRRSAIIYQLDDKYLVQTTRMTFIKISVGRVENYTGKWWPLYRRDNKILIYSNKRWQKDISVLFPRCSEISIREKLTLTKNVFQNQLLEKIIFELGKLKDIDIAGKLASSLKYSLLSGTPDKGRRLWQAACGHFLTSKQRSMIWERCPKEIHSIFTLKRLLSRVNPAAYAILMEQCIAIPLEMSLKPEGGDADICNVFQILSKGIFKYCPYEKIWFWFNDHFWRRDVGDIHILRKMQEYLVPIYDAVNKTDPGNPIIIKIIKSLKSARGKKSLLEQAKLWLADDKFRDKKDQNKYLIGFDNGIYDLRKGELRPGNPNDCVTLSCGYDFPIRGYKETSKDYKFMMEYFKRVFVNKAMRKYIFEFLATLFKGGNEHKMFPIWTNYSGNNSKSVLQRIVKLMLGEYCTTLPARTITGRSAASGAASPEFALLSGVRVAFIDEPNKTEKINPGTVKLLTGGDAFYVRKLYSDPLIVIPTHVLIMVTNLIPGFDAEDPALLYRIEPITFKSRFVKKDLAPKTLKEQFAKKLFPMDPKFEEKDALLKIALCLTWFLLKKIWPVNNGQFSGKPREIIDEKSKIASVNMPIKKWFNSSFKIIEDLSVFVPLGHVYVEYKSWHSDNCDGEKALTRGQFFTIMRGMYTDRHVNVRKEIFRGIKKKDPTDDEFSSSDDDDDEIDDTISVIPV